jgi:3-oxoacyl-[acyl-carrier-protein] synthase II
MTESQRVCVTGVGVVSPFGRGADAFWKGLLAGKSAAATITLFDAAALGTRIAAEVWDYAPPAGLAADAVTALDRRSLFAVDAAMQALMEAGVAVGDELSPHVAVVAGAELPERWLTTAQDVARAIGAGGPVSHVANAAAAGLTAIGEAAEWVRRGECAIAVAGGAEAPITPEVIAHFGEKGWLSRRNDDPAGASRPWDVDRDGFVLGEGAAFVVLAREDAAEERGAAVLAHIDGYGATFNRAPVVRPAANKDDIARAMRTAMTRAGARPNEIGGVFCSASGGRLDAIEAQAIRDVWGGDSDAWCTAIKGTVGHALGALGAMGVVAAMFALRDGVIPPTANFGRVDPECGGVQVVAGATRELRGSRVMVNAFGMGHNASVVVGGR